MRSIQRVALSLTSVVLLLSVCARGGSVPQSPADVHKKTISYCVKDASGQVLQEGKIGATRGELLARVDWSLSSLNKRARTRSMPILLRRLFDSIGLWPPSCPPDYLGKAVRPGKVIILATSHVPHLRHPTRAL